MRSDLLSTEEAARRTGYTIQRICQLAAEGKLGAIKRGRKWLILPEAVERLFQPNSAVTESDQLV